MAAARAGPVAGIVLAAGASTRMGRNKLLLTLGGQALVRRAASCATDAGLDPVIVVLGHEAAAVSEELRGLPCRRVVNPDHREGMSSSLRAGIAALPADAAAAVVVLADMPLVTADMLATLVERYRARDAPLVASAYGGVIAPPILYDRTLFSELLTLDGDGCGKRVVRRHRDEAIIIDWPAAHLADLDTPDDYERMSARTEAR